MSRLAVVISHPIQYYAPWFRELTQESGLYLKVFYLWDFGVSHQRDRGFGQQIQWDVPLLEGYDHTFVANAALDPGSAASNVERSIRALLDASSAATHLSSPSMTSTLSQGRRSFPRSV